MVGRVKERARSEVTCQKRKQQYSVVEVLPGIGQWELFQQTGQRQVPVLQTGNEWIADSTAIALHLEAVEPEPALLPKEPLLRAQVLLFEDWADTALASAARTWQPWVDRVPIRATGLGASEFNRRGN